MPACWIRGNPIDYAMASIVGAGLPDEEIAISFPKMIHRKIKAQLNKNKFPITCWKFICSKENASYIDILLINSYSKLF